MAIVPVPTDGPCPCSAWGASSTTSAYFSRLEISIEQGHCPRTLLHKLFQANWYKAEQYCRFHGMHLASINSAEEQRDLQEHIQAYGTGLENYAFST